jgi:hypothetical protein
MRLLLAKPDARQNPLSSDDVGSIAPRNL